MVKQSVVRIGPETGTGFNNLFVGPNFSIALYLAEKMSSGETSVRARLQSCRKCLQMPRALAPVVLSPLWFFPPVVLSYDSLQF
jgi:hypothetical protein